MTPANPDALAESLRKSLAMAASDPGNVVRADGTKVGYKGDRSMGGWIADALIAGPLAPILANLQRVTAEKRSACLDALAAQDQAAENDERARAAEARAAQLQAEVEALREALTDAEQTLRELVRDVPSLDWMQEQEAEGLGPLAAARTALAARAATAREGQTHTPASGALKIEEADRDA